ncbi:hypothetical protein BDW74DRAFT_179560 [Aspergillus multicolor]|uniref:uncharacterized protein n=1 Tax=Aspergillus multicolor TaxID=41759 RepID=UPI003CCD993E
METPKDSDALDLDLELVKWILSTYQERCCIMHPSVGEELSAETPLSTIQHITHQDLSSIPGNTEDDELSRRVINLFIPTRKLRKLLSRTGEEVEADVENVKAEEVDAEDVKVEGVEVEHSVGDTEGDITEGELEEEAEEGARIQRIGCGELGPISQWKPYLPYPSIPSVSVSFLRSSSIMSTSKRMEALVKAHPPSKPPRVGNYYAGWYRAPNGERYFGYGTAVETGRTHSGGFYVDVEPVLKNLPGT